MRTDLKKSIAAALDKLPASLLVAAASELVEVVFARLRQVRQCPECDKIFIRVRKQRYCSRLCVGRKNTRDFNKRREK